MSLETVLASVASGGLCGSIVVYVLRDWIGSRLQMSISHEYDRKLHEFKAKIDTANSVEVEKLRSSLQLAAAEHHVRFSRLHEKGAETMAGAFERLHRLQTAVADYVSITGATESRDERRKAVDAVLFDLRDYVFPNEIYMPASLAKKTRDLLLEMNNIANQWSIWVHDEPRNVKEGHPREPTAGKVWGESAVAINQRIPELMARLADEYRRVLWGDHPFGLPTPDAQEA
jgi:hypothetical protein